MMSVRCIMWVVCFVQVIEADKLPLIVVLDDVRSMHNVGSVFRTGDAFRIEAVYLCGITSTPPMAEIHKTALGAEDMRSMPSNRRMALRCCRISSLRLIGNMPSYLVMR